MAETYFTKFPTTIYSGYTCTDITRRVVLDDKTRNQTTLFYPYEIKKDTRPDVLADVYYDDPYYDWLIYITNGIVDPYYGWYLSEDDMGKFIISKYGSIEQAQKLIKYYRLNWSSDDISITPSFYFNSLPFTLRKYYNANFGYGSKVISFTRKREDWVVNTNKILRFTINLASNTQFTNSELVDIRSIGVTVGTAQIVICNSTSATVQHIAGNTSANNILVGETSNASAIITDTDLLYENITVEEAVYWSPVSFYDFEVEQNEQRKFVQLLDANYALDTAENIRVKLKEE